MMQTSWSITYRVKVPCHGVCHAITLCAHLTHQVLAADDKDLEINALKIKQMFPSDLERARDDGTCGNTLHKLIMVMRRMWKADTRDSETMNKQIGILAKRAPNAQLDLISSRVLLRHALNRLSGAVRGQRAVAHAVARACNDNIQHRHKVTTRHNLNAIPYHV